MVMQRRRLPPVVRIGQILDAALQEFSQAGYAGARMDDIALRAGLSKGGLYAHFDSKEAVFEALLTRHLSPSRLDIEAVVDGAQSPRHLAERIVNHLYVSLGNAAMISTMRLLLAESGRVPHLAARWRQETAQAHQTDIARLLERARDAACAPIASRSSIPGCCCRPSFIPWSCLR
jgi:AcrR family transcriptional regulator